MTTTQQKAAEQAPHPDQPAATFPWARLRKGDSVTFRAPTGSVITGNVEIRSDDGAAVWILSDRGWNRRLIHQDEGYELIRAGDWQKFNGPTITSQHT